MKWSIEEMKENFFDREKVDKSLDAPSKRTLSKWSLYAKRTAKKSLKRAKRAKLADLPPERQRAFRIRKAIAKRKKEPKPTLPDATSDPGKPPLLHARTHKKGKTGGKGDSPLKTLIFNAYDPKSRSAVAGPVAFNTTRGKATKALEYGGRAKVRTLTKSRKKKRQKGHRAKAFVRARKRVTVSIAARPFMRPAGDKHLSILKDLK